MPQVFVNGEYFGDFDTIGRLNETGKLKELLRGFEVCVCVCVCVYKNRTCTQERPDEDCSTCGGSGFTPCTWCRGSKKSFLHPFGNRSLKCTVCNEVGLVRCSKC